MIFEVAETFFLNNSNDILLNIKTAKVRVVNTYKIAETTDKHN